MLKKFKEGQLDILFMMGSYNINLIITTNVIYYKIFRMKNIYILTIR